jgi:Xaa-Pro aminopeptidase
MEGKLELFMDDETPASILWHGPSPTREQVAQQMGADAAFPLAELPARAGKAATIAVQDAATRQQQTQLLDRPIATWEPEGIDCQLAEVIVQLRLCHDSGAVAEMRQAAAVSVAAHQAGMAATATASIEAEVRAAMESVIAAHNMTCAYGSIVTIHGEVLHNDRYHHPLRSGDLLLADVGAETASGWAADITRTWPVSGRFSATQRDLYDVVLAAHDACIAAVRPTVEYRDIHLLACQTIAEGLVDLGILRGAAEDLVEQDAHALFFPHGVGHLLGLDVHDMEDLGRSSRICPQPSAQRSLWLKLFAARSPLAGRNGGDDRTRILSSAADSTRSKTARSLSVDGELGALGTVCGRAWHSHRRRCTGDRNRVRGADERFAHGGKRDRMVSRCCLVNLILFASIFDLAELPSR